MKLKEQKKFGILWLSIGAALFLAGLLLGETEYGSYIGGFGGGHGPQKLSLVPLVAVCGEALDIADAAVVHDGGVHRADGRRVHMAGSAALIARMVGKRADVGHLLPLVQRQCAQIAQEHTALLGQLDSQTAVCGAVRGGRLGRCGQKSAYNVRCSAV